MERIIINVNGLRRTNSFLERAKASIAVKNTCENKLMEVLATETKKACGMAPVWNITL
jgi:hypothetical protein